MLLGRVYRRLNSDANVKLFSGNTSLLETFSQIVGSSRGTWERQIRLTLCRPDIPEGGGRGEAGGAIIQQDADGCRACLRVQ